MDWDGDGDIDLSAFFGYSPVQNVSVPIQILLNNGAGVFTDGTAALFPNGAPRTNHPRGDVVADFNGDGRPDLFIADHGNDALPFPGYQNQLVLSSGARAVVNATSTLPQLSDYSHSAAGGDIDGDGDIDLLVMNVHGGTPPTGALTAPYFLINNGQGQFTRNDRLPADILPRDQGAYLSVAMLDADQDRDLDIVLGIFGQTLAERSIVLFNPGNGDFSNAQRLVLPAGPPSTVATWVVSITVGDWDMDGDQDFILIHNERDQHYYLQFMMNKGGGQFVDETQQRLPQNYAATTNWIDKLQPADINGDGYVDLVMPRRGFPPIYLNDGAGRFVQLPASFLNYNGWGTPENLNHIPLDINGDGRIDIVADPTGGPLLVFTAIDPGLTLAGTAAADALVGDASNEVLTGLAGDDVLFAAQGDDTLDGGAGRDNVNGGAGNDIIIVRAGEFATDEVLDGGTGTDTLRTTGSIDYRAGAVRNFERIQFVRSGTETTLNIQFNAAQLAAIGSAVVLTGSAAQDSIQVFATSGAAVSTAGWTFDFPAWGFDDYIVYVGDTGNESFVGFTGLDIFFGSPGNDTFDGRGAVDFAAYLFSPNAVTADLSLAGPQNVGGNQGFDTFINLEGLAGSQLADNLFGDGGANFLLGLHGADALVGRAGDDDIRGGEHADRIEGGMGADTLWGAMDAASMSGPDGADTFVYRTALEGGDTIVDFQAGVDRIEVSASGFGLTAGAAVQFSASTNPAVSGTGPQFAYDTDDGFLYFDPDGAGAQQAIRLATLVNRAAITGSDIVVTSIAASFVEADDLPLAKADADQQPEVSLAGDAFDFGIMPVLGADPLVFV